MDDLTKLWERWSEGVVPPEAMLWGMELYWWNRLAIALQALALVIVFFELIGTDRRRKIVAFFDADAYYTITAKVAGETKKLAALIDITLRSCLFSTAYLVLYVVRASGKRLDALLPDFAKPSVSNGCNPLTRAILKLHKIDRQQSRKYKALGVRWISYYHLFKVSTGQALYVSFYALIMYVGFYWLVRSDPAYASVNSVYHEPFIHILHFLMIFSRQVVLLPLFVAASTVKIVFIVLSPVFKRFFHEHYEHHWIAAVLVSSLVGLHFSILIG